MVDRDFVFLVFVYFSIGYPRFLARFAWFSSENFRSLSIVRGVRMEESELFRTEKESSSSTVYLVTRYW